MEEHEHLPKSCWDPLLPQKQRSLFHSQQAEEPQERVMQSSKEARLGIHRKGFPPSFLCC